LDHFRMYPIASGHKAPPMFPDMFIAPESDPACTPPTSIAAPQAPGITRSLEKLAIAMESMANSGLATTVEKSRKPLAPVKPMYAMIRRDRPTSPILRASLAPNHTLMGLAKPPKNSGSTFNH